jgi:hypothetical protein
VELVQGFLMGIYEKPDVVAPALNLGPELGDPLMGVEGMFVSHRSPMAMAGSGGFLAEHRRQFFEHVRLGLRQDAIVAPTESA